MNMDLSTSWARAITQVELARAAVCLAAKLIAARVVVVLKGDEIQADAEHGFKPTAKAAAEKTTPRRVRLR